MDPALITILLHVNAAAIALLLYVTLWFVLSLGVGRNDVADLAWGLGIAFVGMLMVVVTAEYSLRVELLATMVFVWGIRLTLHMFHRFARTGEDHRYAVRRREWKRWFMPRTYAQVFLLQGFLMLVVAYPFIHASAYPSVGFAWWDVLGVIVWICGLVVEVASDRQLARFTGDPANTGGVLDTGLWRYSRHPNYFGEVLQWWGVALVLLSVPFGYVAFVSPILMTFLILTVSGIPVHERLLTKNPAYRAYMERTSVFIPLPPTCRVVDKKK